MAEEFAGIPITAAGRHLGVMRRQRRKILAEEPGISPEMALPLGEYCGNGPHLWIRMQEAYDLGQARRRMGAAVGTIPTMRVAETA